MKLFLKYSLLSIFLVLPAFAAPSKIKESHLENYVSQYLDQLFYPHHRHSERNALINHLVQGIKDNASSSQQPWSWLSWAYETSYSVDYVEQIIRGETIIWIQHKAFDIAKKMKQSTINAQKIADRIYQELLTFISTTAYLDQGVFAGYVDQNLVLRIKEAINQIQNPLYSSEKPTTSPLYSHADCVVCQEKFDQDVRQLFLKPCGHDICASCAEQWFFTYHKTTCPHCRTRVNLQILEQTLINMALSAPSAPALT